MKMLLSTLLVLTGCVFSSEAYQLENKLNESRSQWGTCFVLEGYVITAYHVVKDEGEVLVNKTKCKLVLKDEFLDLAILKPQAKLEKCSCEETGCFASVRGEAIKRLNVKEITDHKAIIEGFGSGGSGSPVYSKGKLLGMAYGYSFEDTNTVSFLPERLIRLVLKNLGGF